MCYKDIGMTKKYFFVVSIIFLILKSILHFRKQQMIRTFFRRISRLFFRFYKREYGRYTILVKLFFPYLAPKSEKREIVRAYHNLKMEVDSREYIQAMIYLFGNFEPPTIKFLEKYIKKGDLIFDIGANVGYHTLIFSELTGENGSVFAFEPEPDNYKTLKKNVDLNSLKNVICINKALSDREETLNFYVSKSFNKGTHFLVYNPIQHLKDPIKIDVIPLSNFIKENNIKCIDFIKIDVEGAEFEVIKGMEKSLIHFKPTLLVEINNEAQETHGKTSKSLKEYICGLGYDPYDILEDGNITESPVERIHNVENVAFIPRK